MGGAKATSQGRPSRTRTVPDYFQKQQQKRQLSAAVTRKRVSHDDTDDQDASSSSSEREHDELDSDHSTDHDDDNDANSDNEFNINSLSRHSNVSTSKGTTRNNKQASKAKGKQRKTGKRRRLNANEITLESNSQLLSQVTDMDDDGTSLYEQVLAVDADTESMASTWEKQYKKDKVSALKDLINYVIRSSGCKMAVTAEAFEDENSSVDALQELQAELSKLPYHEYPIISKAKAHKHLKRNLLQFFQALIEQCQHELLYDGTLIDTLQSWLTTMSSSVYRPFRHTSTLIALKVTESLCTLAEKARDEHANSTRQLAAARRKGNTGSTNLLKRRLDVLMKKRKDFDEYIKDFFESVFVHRFRDVESIIRNECVKELCGWIQLYPAYFAGNQYFRYFGWSLNDPNPAIRCEALKAIAKLCKTDTVVDKMTTFIQRFAARVEEMALYDVDVSARVNAITLCYIYYNQQDNVVTDQSRDALTGLAVSNNARIRKAVAPFVKSIIDTDIYQPSMTQVQQTLAALSMNSAESTTRNRRAASTTVLAADVPKAAVNKSWVVFKSIADFLTPRVPAIGADHSIPSMNSPFVFDHQSIQVIDNTVETLWGLIQELQDIQAMADYLCRDHSSSASQQANQMDDTDNEFTTVAELESCYRLTSTEETILVYVFVICLKKVIKKAAEKSTDRKNETVQHDHVKSNLSRSLVQTLPKLLRKHGDDINRLTQLIEIPQMMNLDVYLELRMEEAYKQVLQQLCKLYASITLPQLLATCSASLQHMIKANFMSEINDPLLGNLQEKVVNQVRDACRGKDLYTARFSTDHLQTITTTVTRLDYLSSIVDVTNEMDDVSDSKADVTELMGELVDRSVLGYEGESQVSKSALSILFRYLVWRCSSLVENEVNTADRSMINKVERRRNWAIEKCLELISISSDTESLPDVRQSAFGTLISIYSVFSSGLFKKSDLGQLHLKCPESTQLQLVAYMTSEIKAFKGSRDNDAQEENERNAKISTEDMTELLINYGHALIMGVLESQYGVLLLEQYGQLGDEILDAPIKAFVEELQSMLNRHPKMTDSICRMHMKALEKSFEQRVDTNYRSLDKTLRLGRLLCQCFKQSEPQRIPEDIICELIHTEGINFTLAKAAQVKNDPNGLTLALKFFKVLTLFAKQLNRARDVGRIHKHMQSRLREYELKPTEGEKEWEPYFGYITAMDELLKTKGLRYDHSATH